MKTNDATDPLKGQETNLDKKKADHTPQSTNKDAPLLDDHEENSLNASYDKVDEELEAEGEVPKEEIHKAEEKNAKAEEALSQAKGEDEDGAGVGSNEASNDAPNDASNEASNDAGKAPPEEPGDGSAALPDSASEGEPSSSDEVADEPAKPAAASKDEAQAEQINYALLSQEDLVKLLREKLDHPGKGKLREDVDGIRNAYFDKQRETVDTKKKHFLEEGGELEDFKPVEDPLDSQMKELLDKYRGMKTEYTKQLEKTKQENLEKKQELLEEFRLLMEGQESFELTFRKFKDLQRQWFAVGIVPQSYLKDLWDSYNYFVDKFNDYVRINRELRALDLKKNLELKIQLCEKTEALDQEENLVQAFKTLQKHHARWREIGPVPQEKRDEIWERFKAATSVINHKHQEFHTRMKESLQENLEKKAVLCEKVEAIAEMEYNNHRDWVEKTRQVLDIQKTWKSIGYAPKKDNNTIYARFRKACDQFFNKKAAYYAQAYEEQKSNLIRKREIVEKAEAIKDSQDWKNTSAELIRLQKLWKEIGPVPKKHADKLWKQFRGACDTFFQNKSKFFEDVDSTFDDNLKAKEAVIAEVDAYEAKGDRKSDMKALEEFNKRFNAIGYVPSAKKDWIKDQFRKAQDRLLERMGLDESEQSIFRFKNRISSIMQAPRAEMKLNFERDKLLTRLQQQKSEIGTWENNIGFFKQSDSSDDTIRGFQEKIDAAHERIKLLEMKIRILDDMENAN